MQHRSKEYRICDKLQYANEILAFFLLRLWWGCRMGMGPWWRKPGGGDGAMKGTLGWENLGNDRTVHYIRQKLAANQEGKG